jgi:hypothetical protein
VTAAAVIVVAELRGGAKALSMAAGQPCAEGLSLRQIAVERSSA